MSQHLYPSDIPPSKSLQRAPCFCLCLRTNPHPDGSSWGKGTALRWGRGTGAPGHGQEACLPHRKVPAGAKASLSLHLCHISLDPNALVAKTQSLGAPEAEQTQEVIPGLQIGTAHAAGAFITLKLVKAAQACARVPEKRLSHGQLSACCQRALPRPAAAHKRAIWVLRYGLKPGSTPV